MYYLKTFFIYSIFGFLLESLIVPLWDVDFISGVLYGPWTPIYGIGAITIIFIYNFLDIRVKNNFLKFILLFLLSSIMLTFLEWCAGMLIEGLFNKIYWNYENMKYNIGHYVSLEISLLWGCASVIISYLFRPLIDKFIKHIPNQVIYVITFLFVIDCILIFLLNNTF